MLVCNARAQGGCGSPWRTGTGMRGGHGGAVGMIWMVPWSLPLAQTLGPKLPASRPGRAWVHESTCARDLPMPSPPTWGAMLHMSDPHMPPTRRTHSGVAAAMTLSCTCSTHTRCTQQPLHQVVTSSPACRSLQCPPWAQRSVLAYTQGAVTHPTPPLPLTHHVSPRPHPTLPSTEARGGHSAVPDGERCVRAPDSGPRRRP